MLVEVDYTHFHQWGYPDCECGRSSRWYAGITNKKFTCIFCLSHTEEGSPEAVAIYGYMGDRHRFLKEVYSGVSL